MKKIFLFMLLIFYTTNVYAYTYYTDYSDEIITSDYIEPSDLISVEKRFKFYHEDIIKGPYTNEVDSKNYRYIDSNDFIKIKSNYFKIKPLEKDNRTIYEVTDSFNNSKIGYMVIDNVNTHDNSILISNIKVTNNGENISYGYGCNPDCKVNSNNEFELYNKTKLKLYFDKLYYIDGINVTFNVTNNDNKPESFYMYFGNDTNELEKYDTNVNCLYKDNNYNFDLSTNGLNYIVGRYNKNTLYYYEDIFYRTFNKDVIYNDTYTTSGTDYYNNIDLNDYIYVYKKRDKLELKDELIIKNNSYNLKDYIINNTNDVEIIDNIDISKDGVYKVIYKMGNKQFDTYFNVDLINEDYNSLIDIIDDYSNLDKTKSEVINTLNEENNSLNKKIDSLIKENENKKLNIKTQQQSKETTTIKGNNQTLQINYSKLSIIVLSIFGIIIISYLIIKRKKYN